MERELDYCFVVDVLVLLSCDTGLLNYRLLTFRDDIMVTKRRKPITE
jgi:hypothetical protein